MYDPEGLLLHILEVDEDAEDYEEQIEEKLYDKYGMDVDQFNSLIWKLINMVDIAESPITKVKYKGFSRNMGEGNKEWICKIEVK